MTIEINRNVDVAYNDGTDPSTRHVYGFISEESRTTVSVEANRRNWNDTKRPYLFALEDANGRVISIGMTVDEVEALMLSFAMVRKEYPDAVS